MLILLLNSTWIHFTLVKMFCCLLVGLFKATTKPSKTHWRNISIMPEDAYLSSMKPPFPTLTPHPSFDASPTAFSLLTTTALLPRERFHIEGSTLLIVVIFCVVFVLLLSAFFYAFCFHCSIGTSLKDSHADNGCSLDHEDATYKCSSSDNQSVGNVVWLWCQTKIIVMWLWFSFLGNFLQ